MYSLTEVRAFPWVRAILEVLTEPHQRDLFLVEAARAANHRSARGAVRRAVATASSLGYAFVWSATPQGDRWWRHLQNALVAGGWSHIA